MRTSPRYRMQVRPPRTLAIAVILGIACSIGCGRDRQSTVGGGNPLAPSSSVSGNPTLSSGGVIHVGETVRGTIADGEPTCTFTTFVGGWGGVCQAFEITVPSNGTLTATLRVNDALVLFFKTAGGAQIDMACCGSTSLQVPVEAGTTYRIEVAYSGRPPGYPHITPADYTLGTALATGDTQTLGSVRALIFADEKRTQRLGSARLEVVDGPQTGAVADLDPSTGIYEIRGLPIGFVQVTASADGFAALATRIAVGLNVPNEFVLQRLVPLPDATNSLGGLMFAYPSQPGDSSFSAWGGVKVEIVDGPLAGIFTVSDDDFGMYQLSGLPPGLVHVRASADWLESQTLEVVVSGRTTLHFVMKRK